MKTFTLTLSVGILLCCSGCKKSEVNQPTQEELKFELREAIDAFNQAFAAADTSRLRTMLTEDYQHSNSYYEAIGKETWLEYVGQRREDLDSGEMELLGYGMDQDQLQIIGNTGILSGRINVKSRFGVDTFKVAYRITNVWVKVGESWKRAAFHDGKIK
ncbi:MAG: nuclear transport factor 2 family protein [Bacteroidota bacterium]